MARFLTTIPSNSGFVNFGTVESYPTGGTGPTAYGPTSYFGSDPRPAEPGDSLYTAIDLGDFSTPFRTLTLSNSHGGLSRKQTTFYKTFDLGAPDQYNSLRISVSSATRRETNRNTLILLSIGLKMMVGGLNYPSTIEGYVSSPVSSIDYNEEDLSIEDYPSTIFDKGEYLFLITNDIRYLETTY